MAGEADALQVRAFRAVRGLCSGPVLVRTGPHYGKGMETASFLYRGKFKEVFEVGVPVRKSTDAETLRADLIAQMSGMLDLAADGHAWHREARQFVKEPREGEIPVRSEALAGAIAALKRRLLAAELIVVPQSASPSELLETARSLAPQLEGPSGLTAALGIFHLYSCREGLGSGELEVLGRAALRILEERKLGDEIRFNCAAALEMSGNFVRGREVMRDLYASGDRSISGLNLLAMFEAMDGGNMKRSLRLGRELTKLAPDDPCVWDTYGYALFKAGDLSRALAAFRIGSKYIDLSDTANPDTSKILEHYTEVLDRAGKLRDAARWRENAAKFVR